MDKAIVNVSDSFQHGPYHLPCRYKAGEYVHL
jgi:hypothetical protein